MIPGPQRPCGELSPGVRLRVVRGGDRFAPAAPDHHLRSRPHRLRDVLGRLLHPAGTGPAAIIRHESVIGSYAAPSKLAGSPHNGPPPTSAPQSSLVAGNPDHTTSSDPVHTDVGNALGVSGDADRGRHDGAAVARVVLVGVNATSVATVNDVDVDSVVDGGSVEATPMSVTGLDTVEPGPGGSLPTPSSAPPQPTNTAISAASHATEPLARIESLFDVVSPYPVVSGVERLRVVAHERVAGRDLRRRR